MRFIRCIIGVTGIAIANFVSGQVERPPLPVTERVVAPTTRAADPMVELNFPANTPLVALISYVSERRGVNFIYDEAVGQQPMTLRTPKAVPQSQLMGVLVSVLQSRNLILEDTMVPGLYRIVTAQSAVAAPAIVVSGKELGGNELVTSCCALKHVKSDQILPIVMTMLSKPTGRASMIPDRHVIVVTDYAVNVQRIMEFLSVIDTAPDQANIRLIPVRFANCKQLAHTLQAIIQGSGPSLDTGRMPVSVVPDEANNQVIITGSANSVELLAAVVGKLDQANEIQHTMCFYKLLNTVAADILSTLRSLDEGGSSSMQGGAAANKRTDTNSIPAFGQPLPSDGSNQANAGVAPDAAPDAGPQGPEGESRGSRPIITADEKTNTIIIIATAQQQQMYKELINKLDERQPQVMIETTIVALDTSDGFTLGVDFAGKYNDGKIISFSSFGVSELDPKSGSLSPISAPGGTLALLNKDIADVVIHALSTNSRARLVSMPRILVNDNSIGKLSSVQQEPFQRTVVSNSTTIIGEGSNAEAGTTISVTPHISTGNYLQLDYAVELSSFTGLAQDNLPPPSQKNTVASKVTIPDSHTIVVGGLNRSTYRETVNSVPLLGSIPGLEYLFSKRTKNQSNTTLFVFIRPSILRDDNFRDLKYLSSVDQKAAKMPGDLPVSEPVAIQLAQ